MKGSRKDEEASGEIILASEKEVVPARKKSNIVQDKLEVRKKLRELGFDPIEGMVAIADNDKKALGMKSEKDIPIYTRLEAISTLMQFAYAKPKQIEVQTDQEAPNLIPVFTPRRGDLPTTAAAAIEKKSSEEVEEDNE